MLSREIKKPDLNEKLAEFIGVHIGDGTLTPNLLRITGNKIYDENYFLYLKNLVFELFELRASILYDKRKDNQRNNILLSIASKNLAHFLHREFQIPYGNKIKNECSIPGKIIENRELSIACLRGLVDTDGSLSRRDNYMCLAFDSHNPVLLEQVWKIGSDLGIFTYRSKDQIGTNSWKNIQKYFEIVGSSNLSTIVRFKERLLNNQRLYKYQVLDYFDKYKKTELPFRVRGLAV